MSGLRPFTRSDTFCWAVEVPAVRWGVLVPYEVVFPYSNHHLVGLSPPVLPCARSVAATSVTSVAGSTAPLAQPATATMPTTSKTTRARGKRLSVLPWREVSSRRTPF